MLQIVCSFTAGIPNNSLLGSSSTNNLYTSDVEWKVPCQRIDNRYIWVLCPTISLFYGWHETGKFNMGQVIETVLIQSNVLSGHLPIILWLMSSRSEDDEAFALLAGVLVFYQDKDKRKLGWLYAYVIIESIIMVLAKLKIHMRTFAWLETLLALPSISDTASSNNNYCNVCFSFMDSTAVYTNKKNTSKSYPSLIFRFP